MILRAQPRFDKYHHHAEQGEKSAQPFEAAAGTSVLIEKQMIKPQASGRKHTHFVNLAKKGLTCVSP